MILGILLNLATWTIKFFYPLHFSIIAIKEEKDDKLMAVLKYFFLMTFVMVFEYIFFKITSSDLISLLFLGIYFGLVKSNFDYSVLLFNIIFLNSKSNYEKIGSVLKDGQNKLNNSFS